MTHNDIVQKLWNLCDVLRDDGINYSDYVTELVLLLFMKMAHENTEAKLLQKHILPEGCCWTDLNTLSGINLLDNYKRILLHEMGEMWGQAFFEFDESMGLRINGARVFNSVQGGCIVV